MDLSSRRAEFTVFVVERDTTSAKSTAESLQSVGYTDARFYPTLESALAMAREQLPHIIFLDYSGFEGECENFLVDVQALSPEIHVIVSVTGSEILQALQLIGRSLAYDHIVKPFVSSLELIQKLDRAAHELYFQFESEQLREHYEKRGAVAQAPLAVVRSKDPFPQKEVSTRGFADVNATLERFVISKELEATVQIFIEAVSRALYDVPVLYFKYVPSHMSLLFSQAALLPGEKFRGIGLDLKKEDPAQLQSYFQNPSSLPQLRSLIQEVFKRESFTAFGHFNDSETSGVFVVLDETDLSDPNSKVRCLQQSFELAYKRNLTLKEKHTLDTGDGVTGLLNRRNFIQQLDDEIARSRRLLMPVSLIVFDIDGFQNLNQKLGIQQTDAILKTISQILKKTARTNDVMGRVGPDEFACLLPHTGHIGGAIKAERLRRIIESTKIPLLDVLGIGPLTVSCGVGEYPTTSGDADSLFRSADEAMQEVKRAGGNKVCLATAPQGFQMDFSPREIPTSQYNARGSDR